MSDVIRYINHNFLLLIIPSLIYYNYFIAIAIHIYTIIQDSNGAASQSSSLALFCSCENNGTCVQPTELELTAAGEVG